MTRTQQTLQEPYPTFNRLDRTGACWLDSSLRVADKGTTSYFLTNPHAELICSADGATVKNLSTGISSILDCDYLDYLQKVTQRGATAVGYISYEAMLPFVGLTPVRSSDFPLAHFFIYEGTPLPIEPLTSENYGLFGQSPAQQLFSTLKEYSKNIQTLKNHIFEGDIYQANYTERSVVHSSLHPADAYSQLRALNPAPYGAYLNFGSYQVLSSSPERFFRKSDSSLTTGPIKGTIARGNSTLEEHQAAKTLQHSAKNRAELLMIVDLLRNDLGKIARVGTVSVDRLFAAETYSSLIHLVADISCQISESVTIRDIFAALAPGGSVTGAPKKRAVEILQHLESTPRGVYTGAIGYICGDCADFSIAIRTMTHRNGMYTIAAGGGIVHQSEADSEYEEMQLKARNLARAVLLS